MAVRRAPRAEPPFPLVRPEIRIEPVTRKPYGVDCRELRWWFAVPKVGDRTQWAIYDPPDWKLNAVSDVRATGLAEIHGQSGTEIAVEEWDPREGWLQVEHRIFGTLTQHTTRWLATMRSDHGATRLYTFQDPGFDDDYGEAPRRIEDRGRFARLSDGSLEQAKRRLPAGAKGAGLWSLAIGSRQFTCLRVIDVPAEPAEDDVLIEAYLTRQGRSLLVRRYNGRHYGLGTKPWDVRFPHNETLMIDGVTFVHWYDCLSHRALPRARTT